ncbi:MAG: diguanylate cyclase [Pseudomonas sp.]|uniref:sensor domain-containing diguanylate cyclase n=1 Tax=Pseudomonas sp. TaxID=306 RepID=UPI00121BB5F0|nr:diguanylate cyclase [Pseudomonas sp.]RZI73173.1 MAG: diguanylate cyclase [Pseudomonas sp.]
MASSNNNTCMHRTKAQAKSVQRRTVRATTLFVVFVCLSLLAVDVWLAWRAREQQLRQAVVSNTNLAAAVAQQMDGMVSEVGHLLGSIAFELEMGRMDTQVLNHLQPILKNHADSNQHVHGLFVYDAQGAWLINSQGSAPAGANNADRAYFIHHRNDPSLAIRVDKPIVSRSTGVWVIPVSRRLNDSAGHFVGVVLATIDLAHLRELLAGYQIGEHGAVNVAQANTAILVRRPFTVESLGKEMTASAMKQQVLSQPSGNFEIISPVDGVERVASFQRMPNHPLVVTVALSKQEMLSEWRETTWIQTLWIVLLCAITALAGSLVIRAVRQRVKVELDLNETRDELTKANERLAQLASYDGLTGLANRRAFDETLERDFAESCRSGQPLSLVMIDVDHFKQYNDLHGHPRGDWCLQQVARAIESAARRPLDFVARYGGEEMVMVLPNTDAAGALVVAEMARSTVQAMQILHSTQPPRDVSISLGVASRTFDNALPNMQALIQRADEALYQAKAAGRNQVVVREQEKLFSELVFT